MGKVGHLATYGLVKWWNRLIYQNEVMKKGGKNSFAPSHLENLSKTVFVLISSHLLPESTALLIC